MNTMLIFTYIKSIILPKIAFKICEWLKNNKKGVNFCTYTSLQERGQNDE